LSKAAAASTALAKASVDRLQKHAWCFDSPDADSIQRLHRNARLGVGDPQLGQSRDDSLSAALIQIGGGLLSRFESLFVSLESERFGINDDAS
jgi:hypothetical protein